MRRTEVLGQLGLAAFIVLASGLGAWAVSVTVNSEGGADHATIGEALEAVNATPAEDNVITITGGGPCEEPIAIYVPLTLKGQDSDNRPIILLLPNLDLPQDTGRSLEPRDGIVNMAPVDMAFENLIIIPSVVDPPGDAIDIECFSDSDQFSVNVKNVLLTANDGFDQPVTLDGRDQVDLEASGALSFRDDGFSILCGFGGRPEGTIEAVLEDFVVSHCFHEGGNDGFILGGSNVSVTMRNVISSYNSRFGYQILQRVAITMEGTPEEPIVALGNGSTGFRAFQGRDHQWSNLQAIENAHGVGVDADTTDTLNIDHLLVTGSSEGFYVVWPPDPAERNYTVSDSTFLDNAATISIYDNTSNLANVEFTDCVFAGIPEGATKGYL